MCQLLYLSENEGLSEHRLFSEYKFLSENERDTVLIRHSTPPTGLNTETETIADVLQLTVSEARSAAESPQAPKERIVHAAYSDHGPASLGAFPAAPQERCQRGGRVLSDPFLLVTWRRLRLTPAT